MRRLNFHYFPRNINAGALIENFLISAVVSILVIRAFLHIFGYPQLGSEGFHIAHMLWGGFLMMISILALFIFLNKEVEYITSILGGIGFGTFVDELGKFITNDNNYFYQPTVALLYVLFVLLFIGARMFERYFKLTQEEYAVNALEMTKQAVMHDLDEEEKKTALSLLKKADPANPIVKMLRETLEKTSPLPKGKPNIFHQIRDIARKTYLRLIRAPSFSTLVVTFFVATSLVSLFQAFFSFTKAATFSEWGQLIFSVVSGIFVLIGVYFLRYKNSRNTAYEMFKYAVIFSILLTQFFRFLQEQLSAITGLFLNLVILSVLQYLIYEEKLVERQR